MVRRAELLAMFQYRKTRAAGDETAFRRVLVTTCQLREAVKRMTDTEIIDAFENAHTVAEAVGWNIVGLVREGVMDPREWAFESLLIGWHNGSYD